MMTLKKKLEQWRDLQAQADALAEEIRAEVLALGQTIRADGVVATYGSRGRYDYEALAKFLEPDDETIQRHTVVKIDWRKVVDEVGAPDELRAKFYTPGAPYVSLKLKG